MSLINQSSRRRQSMMNSTINKSKFNIKNDCDLFKQLAGVFVSKDDIEQKILSANKILPGLADTINDIVSRNLQKETNKNKEISEEMILMEMKYVLSDFMRQFTDTHAKKCSDYLIKQKLKR